MNLKSHSIIVAITLSVLATCDKPEEDLTVTDIDGNIYSTIQVGDQIQMAENLKVTHYRDGSSIQEVANDSAWESLERGAFCVYNNNASNELDTFGNLYNWYAVADTKQIAPDCWHIPTDIE